MTADTSGGLTFHDTARGRIALADRAGCGGNALPPLVLLHGFPLNHTMWNGQIEALGGDRRVIAPDLPGFGQSKTASPFTIESLAEDVHRLLGELGALPCVLAGLSMGGYVALAYAVKFPATLCGLVLIDTRAEADSSEGKQNRDKMIELARSAGSDAIGQQMLPKLVTEATMKNRLEIVRAIRDMAAANSAETLANALAVMRDRPDRTEQLASIAVLTLIIVGELDSITPPPMSQAMHLLIPRSRLVTIAGAGHMSPMEQSDGVNEAMRRFLETLPAAGQSR